MDGENSGKPYQNGWIGSSPIFGNIHIYLFIYLHSPENYAMVIFFQPSIHQIISSHIDCVKVLPFVRAWLDVPLPTPLWEIPI